MTNVRKKNLYISIISVLYFVSMLFPVVQTGGINPDKIQKCKKYHDKCQNLMSRMQTMMNGVDSHVNQIEGVMAILSKNGQGMELKNFKFCLNCKKLEFDGLIPHNDNSQEWSPKNVDRDIQKRLFPPVDDGKPVQVSLPLPQNDQIEEPSLRSSQNPENPELQDEEKIKGSKKDNHEVFITKSNKTHFSNGNKITVIVKNMTIIEKPTTDKIPVTENPIRTDFTSSQYGYQNAHFYNQNQKNFQNQQSLQNHQSVQNQKNLLNYLQNQNSQGGIHQQVETNRYINGQTPSNDLNDRNFPLYQQGQNFQGQIQQQSQNCKEGQTHQIDKNYQNSLNYLNNQNNHYYQNFNSHPTGPDYPNIYSGTLGNRTGSELPPAYQVTQAGSQSHYQNTYFDNPGSSIIKPAEIKIQLKPGDNTKFSFDKNIDNQAGTKPSGFEPSSWDFTKNTNKIETSISQQNANSATGFTSNSQQFFQSGANTMSGTSDQKSHITQNIIYVPYFICCYSSGPNGLQSQQSPGMPNILNHCQSMLPNNYGQPVVQNLQVGPTGPGFVNQGTQNSKNQIPSNSQSNSLRCVPQPLQFPPRTNGPQASFRNSGNSENSRVDMTGNPSNTEARQYTLDHTSGGVEESKTNRRSSGTPPRARSRYCSPGKYKCNSGILCIPESQWCDGKIDCTDASDETRCSCKQRVDRDRLCDGNFDCSNAEDELGCMGCPETSFSCENYNSGTMNCVPLSQRCDGFEQCPNGKDEKDCSILSDSVSPAQNIFAVGRSAGYLQKNFQGQWFPVCSPSLYWANEACVSESGPESNVSPTIQEQPVPDILQGPFLIQNPSGSPEFIQDCNNRAIFVQCPQISCGTRIDDSPHQRFYRQNNEGTSIPSGNSSQNVIPFNEDSTDDPIVGIVGGRASNLKAWPFVVALYKEGFAFCGGAIINELWVLTAAHCTHMHTHHSYEVKAGMLRRSTFSPTAQIRSVDRVIVHPEYNQDTIQNDIALMLVKEPFQFNRWVRPICVPEYNLHHPQPDTTCIVVGWGATSENGPEPDNLLEVEVPILSQCEYQNDGAFCAGFKAGGRDACQGDSGGPLFCRVPGSISQWYEAGIVSFGDGCARPDKPGVYTRVSKFSPWINQVIQSTSSSGYSSPMLRSKCPGFQCQSGSRECLPMEKVCDNRVNCLNAEDEINCTKPNTFIQADNQTQFEKPQQIFVNESTQQSSSGNNSGISQWSVQNGGEIQSNVTERIEDIPYEPPTDRFICSNLIQMIKIDKRCNGYLDCEDGTDEMNCTCREALSRNNPNAICDGRVDCYDASDEENCAICGENEYHCRRSGTCIPRAFKCDRKGDCRLNEDELDCFALSNGEYINLDADERPHLNLEGVITTYQNGGWQPFCYHPRARNNANSPDRLGSKFCQYLGFRYLGSVGEIPVRLGNLPERKNVIDYEYPLSYSVPSNDGNQTCSGLYIQCKPVLSIPVNAHMIVNRFSEESTYEWPWQAFIFADGKYRCPAILLETNWLLTSSHCSQNIELTTNYTIGVFGVPPDQPGVYRPHQQVVEIDEIRRVKDSDAALFHLKNPLNRTRHVQAIFNEKRIFPPTAKDLCVAVGVDRKFVSRSMFVKPVLECTKCHRCYVASEPTVCNNNTESRDWSGTVSCFGPGGWYPAAVFKNVDSICSFNKTEILDGIDNMYAHISEAMTKDLQPLDKPPCYGKRCLLGNCIPWDKVCDGITNCPDGADENQEVCEEARQRCENDVEGCKCSKSEMRCGTGQCISKEKFCDGQKDCSDGSDEPTSCTCASFLALTAKHRICDNKRDCIDKSDEDPDLCLCKDNNFYCPKIDERSRCISSDMVCDNYNDCPNGEDEMHCRKLQPVSNDQSGPGEVLRKSFGVWHSECFSTPVTSDLDAVEICKSMGFTTGTIANGTTINTRKPNFTVESTRGKETVSVSLQDLLLDTIMDSLDYSNIQEEKSWLEFFYYQKIYILLTGILMILLGLTLLLFIEIRKNQLDGYY